MSYQVFSTPRLVLSWGARSQTGAQNPIVQGGLAHHHFFLLIFNFKNALSTVQYKLAWHITTPPNFFLLFFCNFFSRYDQLKYDLTSQFCSSLTVMANKSFLFILSLSRGYKMELGAAQTELGNRFIWASSKRPFLWNPCCAFWETGVNISG